MGSGLPSRDRAARSRDVRVGYKTVKGRRRPAFFFVIQKAYLGSGLGTGFGGGTGVGGAGRSRSPSSPSGSSAPAAPRFHDMASLPKYCALSFGLTGWKISRSAF